MFLAVLISPTPLSAEDVFLNQTLFFGNGTFGMPQQVVEGGNGVESFLNVPGKEQIGMMTTRHRLGSSSSSSTIAPNETIKLRFAFGYIAQNKSLESMLAPRFYDPSFSVVDQVSTLWKTKMASISFGSSSKLSSDNGKEIIHAIEREVKWKSIQLLSNAVYHDYYERHVIPQGSEYLYLSGADGAPRDQALFATTAVYLDPKLARETIELIMGVREVKTGALKYAFAGYGVLSSALGLHEYPSDLDIFFLLMISEYMTVTGDWDWFVNASIPFYPKDSSSLPPGAKGYSPLDHVRAAFTHLNNSVGFGPHGLIRIQEGDWDDGIVFTDPDPLAVYFTIKHGESVPNSQMAIYVMRLFSPLVSRFDSLLSSQMKQMADKLVPSLASVYSSKWYGRAWMRNALDEPYLRGNDEGKDGSQSYLDLEAQPWGLLLTPSDSLLSETQRQNIIKEVQTQLDTPIGPRQWPGNDGLVWPAVSQLYTWALASNNQTSLAWETFVKHSYSQHAQTFPDVWLGIWSGPDGWVSTLDPNGTKVHGYEGGTWYSLVTPMTDFPVTNANPDSMFLLALFRIIGIEPFSLSLLSSSSSSSSRASPAAALAPVALSFHLGRSELPEFVLDLPLFSLHLASSGTSHETFLRYKPQTKGPLSFVFFLPPASSNVVCSLNGSVVPNCLSPSPNPFTHEIAAVFQDVPLSSPSLLSFSIKWIH